MKRNNFNLIGLDKLYCLAILIAFTSFRFSMNGNNKKNNFQQNNFNLFAVLIGCVIALTIFAYSKAQYNNYEFPTGNNYTVSAVGTIENGKESDKWQNPIKTKTNQRPRPTETRVAETRTVENQGNWSIEKENQGWEQLVLVRGFPEDSQATKIATYGYKLGWMDFVKMMKCENWSFDIKARWDKWWAVWLCQIHEYYHEDIPQDFYISRQVQVEYCYQKRKSWTKFYWPNRMIKGTPCHQYVENDFTIIKK